MRKKILLTAIVAVFTFSGCVGTEDATPAVAKAKKVTEKVETTTTKVTDVAKKATVKVEEVVTTEEEVATPPESSLKDQAIDKVVEIADDHTDGVASQVIESVQ
ncbi:MAG: hypothetical protein KAU90_12715 [Sulfurovaceae bacterium]|nr:hypothetical protein [Sulfurovaceae bacterium]